MTFASIGDCCVDIYPDKKVLGGMAYNSTLAARKYGADVSIISAIGNDDNGKKYLESFQKNNIDATHVEIEDASTSSVEIALDTSKSPIFSDWNVGALEHRLLIKEDLKFIGKHDIAKIVLLKPFKENFTIFCNTKMPQTIKAGDFDGATPYSFSAKEIAKYINGLDIAIKGLSIDDKEDIAFLEKLAKEKKKIILVTLGKDGSICFDGDKKYIQKVEKIATTNTTGFGDRFIAIFLLTYCKTKNIQISLKEATQVVAIL